MKWKFEGPFVVRCLGSGELCLVPGFCICSGTCMEPGSLRQFLRRLILATPCIVQLRFRICRRSLASRKVSLNCGLLANYGDDVTAGANTQGMAQGKLHVLLEGKLSFRLLQLEAWDQGRCMRETNNED